MGEPTRWTVCWFLEHEFGGGGHWRWNRWKTIWWFYSTIAPLTYEVLIMKSMLAYVSKVRVIPDFTCNPSFVLDFFHLLYPPIFMLEKLLKYFTSHVPPNPFCKNKRVLPSMSTTSFYFFNKSFFHHVKNIYFFNLLYPSNCNIKL